MQKRPIRKRKPGNLISDLVWGVCTLVTFAYAVYLVNLWVAHENSKAGWMALFFGFILLLLASQAPLKGET